MAIENEDQSLRGKLDKRFGAAPLEPGRLGEQVDLRDEAVRLDAAIARNLAWLGFGAE